MSVRRTRLPLLLSASASIAVGSLALPGGAAAQSCQGAPGASALEQYCEAIPRGDGGRQTSGSSAGSGSGGSAGGSGVSAGTSRVLSQAGADGAAVLRLAGDEDASSRKKTKRQKDAQRGGSGAAGSGTGGSGAGGSGAGATGAGSGGSPSDPKDPSGSPLKAAQQAASSGPAAGQAVAWSIVGISVLGALAAVGLRRQRGTLPPVGPDIDEHTRD